uniref:Putative lipocalin-5 1 n=1 Tax=Amblyomma triste TaxID=251400 RepID=A0A023GNK1_AMBTT
MASLLSSFLLVLAASVASGSTTSNNQTQTLIDAAGALESDVAIYDSVQDSSQRCMYTTRPVYLPKEQFAVYVLHYPDGKGGETQRPYCVGLNVTESGDYQFFPCQTGPTDQLAQQLYFDGSVCYVTRIPLNGTYHCILFVKTEDKDSVPENCATQFDEKCGAQRYTLYSKELCL